MAVKLKDLQKKYPFKGGLFHEVKGTHTFKDLTNALHKRFTLPFKNNDCPALKGHSVEYASDEFDVSEKVLTPNHPDVEPCSISWDWGKKYMSWVTNSGSIVCIFEDTNVPEFPLLCVQILYTSRTFKNEVLGVLSHAIDLDSEGEGISGTFVDTLKEQG